MKLLIITQKVDMNDDNLGSFHDWLKKLAQKSDLFVIANYVGKYELSDNVKVFSLGKEMGVGRFMKIIKYQWFLLRLLPKADGIFFHMCPEYVLGASLLPKIFRKKTLLWYTHKSVNWKLKLAEKLVGKIFTASKESFRLPSKKVEITGHGIDIDKFKSQTSRPQRQSAAMAGAAKFKIITAGRIAEVKNIHLLIDAVEILRNKGFDFQIKIAGKPILENDKKYFEKLKEKIREKNLGGIIEFVGPMPNKDIAKFYQNGDLFVNFSDTGSLDKAILEAMACGLKVLTSNEAFKNIVPKESFTSNNPQEIAEKIEKLAETEHINTANFAEYVAKNHGLDNLTDKIIQFFATTKNWT